MTFFVRLYRVAPLLAVLFLVGAIVYFVARFRFPTPRAKQITINFFSIVFGVLSVVFVLLALYGLFDGNEFAAELFASFLVVTLLGLIIARICNWRFLKKWPQYKYKAQDATTLTWWRRLLEVWKNLSNRPIE